MAVIEAMQVTDNNKNILSREKDVGGPGGGQRREDSPLLFSHCLTMTMTPPGKADVRVPYSPLLKNITSQEIVSLRQTQSRIHRHRISHCEEFDYCTKYF